MEVRTANCEDCIDLFNWRNDPISRMMSFDDLEIDFGTHETWYTKSLKMENRVLLIGIFENEKFGVCRFDLNIDDQSTEVSVNVNPRFRARGQARDFLISSIDSYRKNVKTEINARIKSKNAASIRLFTTSGFRLTKILEHELLYTLANE